MTENEKLQVFEDQTIRTAWDEEKEEWYFSVVDVVVALTESPDYKTGRKYWNKLKQRLKEEGNELVTNCHQLKMKAADGKRRLTDVANTEQLLRIIQSIPSKKAEPFKMWLAMVGRERIEEIIDPELTIERALDTYAQKGYPPEWINQRLQTIRAHNINQIHSLNTIICPPIYTTRHQNFEYLYFVFSLLLPILQFLPDINSCNRHNYKGYQIYDFHTHYSFLLYRLSVTCFLCICFSLSI